MNEKLQAIAAELQNVKVEVEGAMAIVTMNRPKAMNALNNQTLGELNTLFDHFRKDNEILGIIKPMFKRHKSRYGYRRIILSLNNDLHGVNHKRIQRIMRENGLFGKQAKHKYHSYKGDNGESKENLLLVKEENKDTNVITFKRDFSTTGPNQKWTTDVSMFKIFALRITILARSSGEYISSL